MTLTLAAWLHDLGPFALQFSPTFGIRWYGLAYVCGFLSGWLYLRWFSKRGLTPMSAQRVGDAMLALVVGVVLGGRLGYVFFYKPSLLIQFTESIPWWGVLRLNEGGMSSHGGMIGVILAALYIARRGTDQAGKPAQRLPVLHVLDMLASACAPGLFFGRLANFVNGELLGRVVAEPGAPAPWWSVRYPQEAYTSQAPIGQEAALSRVVEPYRLAGDLDVEAYERLLTVLHSGGSAAREAAARLEPVLAARHPSQLYQAAAEGLLMGLFLFWLWRKPRKPGFVGCWFLISYGVLRILTELIRLPDADLVVPRTLGLSRGQWLSVAMVLAGSIALPIILRRAVPVFPGWGSPRAASVSSG